MLQTYITRVWRWRYLLGAAAVAAIVSSAVLLKAVLRPKRPFAHPGRIRYDGRCLAIEGRDTLIFSGSFHYFRCPKELWRDRFAKMKEAGFNAVETYVPWNCHEREAPAGLGDFSKVDLTDAEEFLRMAEEFGLYVIARPGPYICAEWDRGGFPGWLEAKRPAAAKAGRWFRSDDPVFVAWSKHWYEAVCPLIARHQITRRRPGEGGVILFQLENEYDHTRMSDNVKLNVVRALAEEATARGIDVPMFTCLTRCVRGKHDAVLRRVFDTCNFYPGWGVDATRLDVDSLRRSQPDAPQMTAELQGGWFTGMAGAPAAAPDADRYDEEVGPSQINNLTLFTWQNGESITNFYMAVGGTNFGDAGGRDFATSYDYSAAVRECGGVGEKYLRVKALGAMVLEHGPRLARSEAVVCKAETGCDDVTVAERRGADGGRYLFIRTSQHDQPRSGAARVNDRDGEVAFNYALEPFGSKVLYLPPGASDATRGEWLPKAQPPVVRPGDLPEGVKIFEARAKVDPGPAAADWKPLSAGQRLNDVGIYDSRFVFYRTAFTLGAPDVTGPVFSGLRVEHPGEDQLVALINGRRFDSLDASGLFGPGPALHAGENQAVFLYENAGYPDANEEIEKVAGVAGVRALPGVVEGGEIAEWRMRVVPRSNRPEDHPEVAADERDDQWPLANAGRMFPNQLAKGQTAVFRAPVDLTPADMAAGRTALSVERMSEVGWVFVNGQKVDEETPGYASHTFDAAPWLHVGHNVVAVVAQCDTGAGGLGRVRRTWPQGTGAPLAEPIAYSDRPAGVAGGWWRTDLDDTGWDLRPLPESAIGALGAAKGFHGGAAGSPECATGLSRIGTVAPGGAGEAAALLTWRRLAFELPAVKPGTWIPWLLRLDAEGNGFIYLNGRAVGRYWGLGGQHDFYLPECWLNAGAGRKNVVTLCLRPVDGSARVVSAEVLPYTTYAERR